MTRRPRNWKTFASAAAVIWPWRSIPKELRSIAPGAYQNTKQHMRQDARKQISQQMLHPTDMPHIVPSSCDIRRAYNAWLEKRGFPKETFKLSINCRRKAK